MGEEVRTGASGGGRTGQVGIAVQHFRLDDILMERGLRNWYANAAVGDTAIVTISSYDCQELRLIRQEHGHVHWWPEGDRGMTVPLEDAVRRLQMLHGPAQA